VQFAWRAMAHRGLEAEDKAKILEGLEDQRHREAREVLAMTEG